MTPPAPRVLFAVPVYNGEQFLERTLDSVLAQTQDDWVVVLVDDASSDGSVALARRYAAAHPGRFEVIALERNEGVVAARNRAIGAIAAELVVLLDHDDWLREDYLERMVGLHDDAWAQGRRVGIVGCDAILHGAGEADARTWSERIGWSDHIDLDGLLELNLIFARALFRRDAFLEVGGFCAAVAGSDDHDLWLRIVEAGYEVAVTREPLANYRVHTGGLSRNRVHMLDRKLLVYARALERGHLTSRQRRTVRRRMRHYRAVRGRWLTQREWSAGRRPQALLVAAATVPRLAVAVLSDPGWLRARKGRRLPDPSLSEGPPPA